MRRPLSVLALAATALSVAAGAASVPPAGAAEPKRPSAGLRAYGLDWIQYIRPRDLPPTRYAVCIVDTGVAITPDTPADNPNGPIVVRGAIDGGPGLPEVATPALSHGTRIAASIAAPGNGSGLVGVFPGGRIVSVRATTAGEERFRVEGYARGIQECIKLADGIPIAAINLSLSCEDCAVGPDDIRRVSDRVKAAQQLGLPVVAAAGNRRGAVGFPANVPGVLAVAAGGKKGRLCPYSARGPEIFAVAPACPVHSADPFSGAFEPISDGGSSIAAAEVSALLAALKTVRPDVTMATIVRYIETSRNAARSVPLVDGLGAARFAGAGAVVERAYRRGRGNRPHSAYK